jgi:hypothetical protein
MQTADRHFLDSDEEKLANANFQNMSEIPLDHTPVVFHNQLKLINAPSAQFITFQVSLYFFPILSWTKGKRSFILSICFFFFPTLNIIARFAIVSNIFAFFSRRAVMM